MTNPTDRSKEIEIPKDFALLLLNKAFAYSTNRKPELVSHIRQEDFIAGAEWAYRHLHPSPSETESPSSIEGEEKISGIDLIARERRRQVEVEGWTTEHDATHQQGEMAMAAAVYAWPESYMSTGAPRCAIITKQEFWPWDEKWYKPGTRISDLVKAGALIAAEIDNQLRLQSPTESPFPALPVKEEEKTLGQILKEARQNKGLTTGKVLYETGVSEEYLRKLEADELKTPSAGVLWKLSQLYSLDLKPLAIKAGIIIKKPPSPAPIEPEKKEGVDPRMPLVDNARAVHSHIPVPTGPNIKPAGEEVPEEYWKQVIAEIRIASLPPDTNETINHIIRQPSTIRLAKFIVAKTNEVIQMYVDVADDQQTCIDKFRAENTALRSKVEALEKEREGYREMLEQMQGWVQIKNLLAKYPPSQEP
jgi:transcriptional regulator with XRE-family HTH domain